jgi:metal-responsive CopG/Arc/MetJ family transcriptional regulator
MKSRLGHGNTLIAGVPASLLERVDDFARDQWVKRSRAIRMLLERALADAEADIAD